MLYYLWPLAGMWILYGIYLLLKPVKCYHAELYRKIYRADGMTELGFSVNCVLGSSFCSKLERTTLTSC